MADFGFTDTGFVPRTTLEVRQSINDDIHAEFGASFGLTDEDPVGVLVGVVAATVGELWEVAEQVSNSGDPDAATGTSLVAVCAITGTIPLAATASTVTLTLTGNPTTPITSIAALTASTSAEFDSDASVSAVLVALATWVGSTAYVVGDRVTNTTRCYQCIVAGTSAASGGPTTQLATIADGSGALEWTWLGDGTGAADITAHAALTGPVAAAARDISVIKTPIGGVQNVINLLDAAPGRIADTNPSLRIRREEELAGSGAGTTANIRALLLRLTGVTAAHVFQNLTDVTDVDGVPPHSIEALVQGGDDQAIVDVLGEEVTAATPTVGTTSGTHIDSEGISSLVNFSRPVEKLIYNRITLVKIAASYAGDTAAQTAVAAYGVSEQVIGKDVVPNSIGVALLPVRINGTQVAGVGGVFKVSDSLAFNDVIGVPVAWVTSTLYSATPGARSVVTNDGGRTYICITAGTSAGGPTGVATDITDGGAHWAFLGADIPVSLREIAVLDTGRTTIISSTGTP